MCFRSLSLGIRIRRRKREREREREGEEGERIRFRAVQGNTRPDFYGRQRFRFFPRLFHSTESNVGWILEEEEEEGKKERNLDLSFQRH